MSKCEAFRKVEKLAIEVINDMKNESWDKLNEIWRICCDNDLFMMEEIKDEEGNRGFMIEDCCYYYKNQEF